jgi:hypothetical protein
MGNFRAGWYMGRIDSNSIISKQAVEIISPAGLWHPIVIIYGYK